VVVRLWCDEGWMEVLTENAPAGVTLCDLSVTGAGEGLCGHEGELLKEDHFKGFTSWPYLSFFASLKPTPALASPCNPPCLPSYHVSNKPHHWVYVNVLSNTLGRV
jgi:hypothetical protein